MWGEAGGERDFTQPAQPAQRRNDATTQRRNDATTQRRNRRNQRNRRNDATGADGHTKKSVTERDCPQKNPDRLCIELELNRALHDVYYFMIRFCERTTFF